MTHEASGQEVERTPYFVGVRGAYQWDPGRGDLYVSPVARRAYTVSAPALSVDGDRFETGPLTRFLTAGIGWTF